MLLNCNPFPEALFNLKRKRRWYSGPLHERGRLKLPGKISRSIGNLIHTVFFFVYMLFEMYMSASRKQDFHYISYIMFPLWTTFSTQTSLVFSRRRPQTRPGCLRTLMFCHSKIKFISSPHLVISFICFLIFTLCESKWWQRLSELHIFFIKRECISFSLVFIYQRR